MATMRSRLLFLVALAFVFHAPALALKKSYIVYMGEHSHGPVPTKEDANHATDSHYDFLASYLGSVEDAKSSIFISYNRHINGFAARIEDDVAAKIAKHPSVVSVFEDTMKQLHTTRSWEFMGLENPQGHITHSSPWKEGSFGENTIIANLDTGVWPESKSFSDEGYTPVPARWKGKCDNGPDAELPVHCNRKLIGARYFSKGAEQAGFPIDDKMRSPRDYNGHGTHTLSTAGGNFVAGASAFGIVNGTVKGGSPRSRVAAYKVCWSIGCASSDILAAFEQAIADGVDVLSCSLGGKAVEFFLDTSAIGAFHAVKHNIVVVFSAGNSGPTVASVSNVAPWMITVAANTLDREVPVYVHLGNKKIYKGTSLSQAVERYTFHPMISGADAKCSTASAADATLCLPGTLDPKKVKGKILVCLRGRSDRTDKGVQAKLAGAIGLVLCNDEAFGNELIEDAHVLPASHVTYEDGLEIYAYLNSTKKPTGYITRPKAALGTKPAPYMAAFSSQGPNPIVLFVPKPDVTAPGVNIMASWSKIASPTEQESDNRRVDFNIMSGTSMSCPHVSGLVGLLKTKYPDWNPAAIRSAIMTTAKTKDNTEKPIKDASFAKGTPFSYGSGHVRPSKALDPGLVYDISLNGYYDFLCSLGYDPSWIQLFQGSGPPYECPEPASFFALNYPSFALPYLNRTIIWTRTLKNVGTPGTYKAKIRAPMGTIISVKPDTLTFEKYDDERTFEMSITSKNHRPITNTSFGSLTWTDGHHYVRSPISVFNRPI
ncbi:hypothetical protein Drorol1_Dr00011642 [Drosera rotundifolia]